MGNLTRIKYCLFYTEGAINRNFTFSVKAIIVHIATGLDWLICPIGGEFEVSIIQIPTLPGREIMVGHKLLVHCIGLVFSLQ